MLEYTNKYWKTFISLAKKSLNKRYGKAYVKELLPKADVEYRRLLAASDDIGSDNPMASNLYEALVFVALWKAADGKISAGDLEGIVGEAIDLPILKLMGLYINLNKPSGVKRMVNMMRGNVEYLEKHPQYKEYSWDFNFDESKNGDGFYYHFTRCPINTLARREGFLEILPILCDIDFKTAGFMHATLHREHTLAQGGEICDYLYRGDKL